MFDRSPEEDLLPGRTRRKPAVGVPEIHFTSLLVSCAIDRVSAIAGDIALDGRTDIEEAPAPGKLIVTLETASLGEVTEFLDRVTRLPGVMNAAMVYHHAEPADTVDQEIEIDETGNPQSDKPGVTP